MKRVHKDLHGTYVYVATSNMKPQKLVPSRLKKPNSKRYSKRHVSIRPLCNKVECSRCAGWPRAVSTPPLYSKAPQGRVRKCYLAPYMYPQSTPILTPILVTSSDESE